MKTLYKELAAAGHEIGSHESDLYVRDTVEVRAILKAFPVDNANAKRFYDPQGKPWIDVPFAFEPYWQKKCT